MSEPCPGLDHATIGWELGDRCPLGFARVSSDPVADAIVDVLVYSTRFRKQTGRRDRQLVGDILCPCQKGKTFMSTLRSGGAIALSWRIDSRGAPLQMRHSCCLGSRLELGRVWSGRR